MLSRIFLGDFVVLLERDRPYFGISDFLVLNFGKYNFFLCCSYMSLEKFGELLLKTVLYISPYGVLDLILLGGVTFSTAFSNGAGSGASA